MRLDIRRLLELTSWHAFDVDASGRVLAGSDESGSVQLVELSAGATTRLTALSGSVTGRYLPDTRTVVVQHDTDGDERAQLSLLHADELPNGPARLADLVPVARDPDHVHRLLDVLPGRIVYATNRRNGVDFDVVIRSVITGEEVVVYDRGGMVLDVSAAPGSQYVALTVPGNEPLSDQVLLINTMPVTGADQVRALTDADVHARHIALGWLPDASGLVVSTDSGRDRTGVARLDPRTGALDWLVTSDEHDLTGWPSPDGSKLLVQSNDDGAARLWLHDAAGTPLHQLKLPAAGWCTSPLPAPRWAPDSRHVVASFSSPSAPGDVLVIDTDSATLESRTDSGGPLDGQATLPTSHDVPTRDREQVPCFVYAPADPDGSSVVLVHGGPESQSVRSYNPVVQALLAQRHTVLVPNVRGSTGYGKRWYSADDRRNRLEAVADLADLHEWLPSLGLDPARAALWGGSYGGYMVLAGLAFQPERWAAGVDVVGISSLETFLTNTAGYRRAHREREYGSPAEDADFLREASPLNRAGSIAAPLFALHGANDPRVPLTEAEQIVRTVRGNGVDCELVVYPDEGHGLAKRTNRQDAYPRALDFLARHLRPA